MRLNNIFILFNVEIDLGYEEVSPVNLIGEVGFLELL